MENYSNLLLLALFVIVFGFVFWKLFVKNEIGKSIKEQTKDIEVLDDKYVSGFDNIPPTINREFLEQPKTVSESFKPEIVEGEPTAVYLYSIGEDEMVLIEEWQSIRKCSIAIGMSRYKVKKLASSEEKFKGNSSTSDLILTFVKR